jgi:signal transduction histidine kinase
MTLKTRLAAMMVFLLMAVMALQYLLSERENRELVERLGRMSSGVEASTRELSSIAHRFAGTDADLDSLIAVMEGDLGKGPFLFKAEGDTGIWVNHVTAEDTLLMVELHSLTGSPDSLAARDGFPRHGFGKHSREIIVEVSPDRKVVRRFESDHVFETDETALAVNLPIPLGGEESIVLRMSYPMDDIARELQQARKRSLWWLSGLVGIGVLGAVALAFQFTRPIRSLQQSFQLVEAGNLDVRLSPKRNDEIGKLTSSFNHMVGRLQETKAMESRLAEAERQAAMGNLAAGVAHEVRNPLNTILLTLEQMRDKTSASLKAADRESYEKHHGRVTAELNRLEQLVSTILDMAGSGQLAREQVDLMGQLQTGVSLFESEARERGVNLVVEGPASLPVAADPLRMATVWNNLLGNALAASARGGVITITAAHRDDGVEVTVSDTGAGMTPEELVRIWEPFYTGRPEGTGLGLTLVRSVVEAHGGTVTASSTLGEGSRFTVTLPPWEENV